MSNQTAQEQTALCHVTGKPFLTWPIVGLCFNVLIDIWLLLAGSYFIFFIGLAFTALSILNLVMAARNTVTVHQTGVSGKVKKEQFQLTYQDISSVSISDNAHERTLLLVSGYHSWAVKIKNAQVVRDAIIYNMYVLGIQPTQIPPQNPTTEETTP